MYNQNMDFSRNISRTNSDKVYFGLRNSIITLGFKPGEEINIKTISENLGISRSPVRDALLKLDKEGLVDILPQKGTFVSRIDLSRVHEELFLRECLEEKTLQLFIANHNDSDISLLKQSIQLQKESLQNKDAVSFLTHDDTFHGIFFKGAEKNMCWDIIQSMSGHYRRIRLVTLWDAALVSDVIVQHTSLVDHICSGNVKEAMKICVKHLSKLLKEEHDLLKQYPDYFVVPATRDAFTGNLI